MKVRITLFQFTPLREGRPEPARQTWPRTYFNSRPYVRGDRTLKGGDNYFSDFNSRPYVRGDCLAEFACPGQRPISIHAPT